MAESTKGVSWSEPTYISDSDLTATVLKHMWQLTISTSAQLLAIGNCAIAVVDGYHNSRETSGAELDMTQL